MNKLIISLALSASLILISPFGNTNSVSSYLGLRTNGASTVGYNLKLIQAGTQYAWYGRHYGWRHHGWRHYGWRRGYWYRPGWRWHRRHYWRRW